MNYDLLTRSPLFKGLETGEIEEILRKIPHKIKKYDPGTVIAQSGEPVEWLILVADGTVKGEMVDYAGRVIKIEEIAAPRALASAFMFGSKNRFPVDVISLTDTELLMISKNDLLKLLKANERILVNFLNMIANRSQFLSEKIKFLSFKTIKGKLAHYILQKAGEDKISVELDKTQNDLADFFGVARPSVSRVLGELEEEGYIIADRRNIRIVNKKGLADLTID